MTNRTCIRCDVPTNRYGRCSSCGRTTVGAVGGSHPRSAPEWERHRERGRESFEPAAFRLGWRRYRLIERRIIATAEAIRRMAERGEQPRRITYAVIAEAVRNSAPPAMSANDYVFRRGAVGMSGTTANPDAEQTKRLEAMRQNPAAAIQQMSALQKQLAETQDAANRALYGPSAFLSWVSLSKGLLK